MTIFLYHCLPQMLTGLVAAYKRQIFDENENGGFFINNIPTLIFYLETSHRMTCSSFIKSNVCF